MYVILRTSNKLGCLQCTIYWQTIPEVLKLWGVPPPPGGALLVFCGEFFVWGTILFWMKYGSKVKMCRLFWDVLCLVEIYYHLVLVPNYKQHILWPAKVRKMCYSLAELCVKCVYLNVFKWRGRRLRNILKGAQSIKILGTSALYETFHA
jgi:hypothetical protein